MGNIGVKGLVVEYGEYPVVYSEYSPTPSLKPLSRFGNPRIWVVWLCCWLGGDAWIVQLMSLCDYVMSKNNDLENPLFMFRRIIPSLDIVSLGYRCVERCGCG